MDQLRDFADGRKEKGSGTFFLSEGKGVRYLFLIHLNSLTAEDASWLQKWPGGVTEGWSREMSRKHESDEELRTIRNTVNRGRPTVPIRGRSGPPSPRVWNHRCDRAADPGWSQKKVPDPFSSPRANG